MTTKHVEAKPRKLGRGLSSLLSHLAPVEVATIAAPTEVPAADSVGGPNSALAIPEARATSDKSIAESIEQIPNIDGPNVSAQREPAPDAAVGGARLVMVAVGEIVPSRFQPRRHFDAAALARLADSMKTAGVMQPLVVRERREGTGHLAPGIGEAGDRSLALAAPSGPGYELVAGERRWRAAQMAGVARVPCVVVEISDEESAEWGLIENVQREDLLPMERAAALANLAAKFSLTQAEVASRVGMERSSVANLVRLLELDEKVQRAIDEGVLSVGHGKALLSIGRESARLPWAERAAREGWSVRQLEERIAQAVVNVGRDSTLKDEAMDRGDELPDGTEEEIRRRARKMMMANLEKRLSNHLGTKVQLRTNRTGNRGKITVHFYTVAQFDGVLQKMGVGEGE